MTKKIVIKEAWLLDENGDKKVKLTASDIGTIRDLVKEEDIKGGYGNIKENE